MDDRMQKWEYIEVFNSKTEFAVIGANGEYYSDEFYRSIDPKGRREEGRGWIAASGGMFFLLRLLAALGQEGWEAVGSIADGSYQLVELLFKRPLPAEDSVPK